LSATSSIHQNTTIYRELTLSVIFKLIFIDFNFDVTTQITIDFDTPVLQVISQYWTHRI